MIIELAASFADSVICIWFITSLLEAKGKKRLISLPACAIYFIITLAGDYFLPGFSILASVILFAASLVYALIICKGRFVKALIICCIFKAVLIISGTALFSVMSLIVGNIDMLMQGENNIFRIITLVIHKMIIIALLIVIGVIFKKGSIMDRITGLVIFTVTMLTILGMGFTMNLLISDPEKNGISCLLIVTVFTLVDLSISVMLGQVRKLEMQKYELESMNDRLESQKDRYEEAIGMWDNIRKERHDIRQHLTVIHSLLEENRNEECREYVEELMPETGKSGKIISSDNLIFDYLINSKLGSLEDTEIYISGAPGDLSDISERDLVSVFGNIIDNAVEAVERIHNAGKKRIELLFSRQGQNRIIVLKNTIEGSVLEKNSDLESSKKGGGTHGLGHTIVEDTVEKLGGMISYSEKDGMFIVHIILPDNS